MARIFTSLLSLIIFGSVTGFAPKANTADQNHRVVVHNASEKKINSVLASSDGEIFDEHKTPKGINPGQTIEVNWNRGQGRQCNWYLKVQYADRSESAPVQFDICEKDVTLEFN